jgi:NitT/TauT family transport system substrate-binding protein
MKLSQVIVLFILLLSLVASGCTENTSETTQQVKVGTWKTAQTIQPFLYHEYVDDRYAVEVLPFTNPGDQKTALLAGNLDMTGTTIALAITAASKGEPVVVVSALTNKCSGRIPISQLPQI